MVLKSITIAAMLWAMYIGMAKSADTLLNSDAVANSDYMLNVLYSTVHIYHVISMQCNMMYLIQLNIIECNWLLLTVAIKIHSDQSIGVRHLR